MKNKKKYYFAITAFPILSLITLLLCQGKVTGISAESNQEWTHFNYRAPTETQKGIKEYWAKCGGGYSLTLPSTGTITDRGNDYDTSGFSVNDERWIGYLQYDFSTSNYGATWSFTGGTAATWGSVFEKGLYYYSSNYGGGETPSGTITLPKLFYAREDLRSFYLPFSAMDNMKIGLNSATLHNGTLSGENTQSGVLYFDVAANLLSMDVYLSFNDSYQYKITVGDLNIINGETALQLECQWETNWERKFYLGAINGTPIGTTNMNSYVSYANQTYQVTATNRDNWPETETLTQYTFGVDPSFTNGYRVHINNYGWSRNILLPRIRLRAFEQVSIHFKATNGIEIGVDANNTHAVSDGLNNAYTNVLTWTRISNTSYRMNLAWRDAWPYASYSIIITDPMVLSGVKGVPLYVKNTAWDQYFHLDGTLVEPTSINHGVSTSVWSGSYHFSNNNFGKQRALELKEAGVDTIIGLCPGFNDNFASFAAYCADIGMNLIPNIDPFDSDLGTFVSWDGTIPEWLSYPSVMGALIHDEPGFTEIDSLVSKKQAWDNSEVAQSKLFFVNLRSASFVLSADGKEYDEYLDKLFNQVNPNVISVDSYPLLADGNIFTYHYRTIEACAMRAKEHNIPFYMAICSAQHDSTSGQLAMPTVANVDWQTNLALAYGARNISHYIYASHETDEYTCMANYTDGSPTDLFPVIETANQHMHAFDSLYAQYNWLGTAAINDYWGANRLFQKLNHTVGISTYGGISSASTNNYSMLVGIFQHKVTGRIALHIVNTGRAYSIYNNRNYYPLTMADITVTLNLVADYSSSINVYIDGVKTSHAVSSNTVSFGLNSYGSAFVEL